MADREPELLARAIVHGEAHAGCGSFWPQDEQPCPGCRAATAIVRAYGDRREREARRDQHRRTAEACRAAFVDIERDHVAAESWAGDALAAVARSSQQVCEVIRDGGPP